MHPVSGGFVRYTRLVEYAHLVQGLLGNTTCSHSGDYFSVRNAHSSRPLPPDLALAEARQPTR